jgi:hypothetical protein
MVPDMMWRKAIAPAQQPPRGNVSITLEVDRLCSGNPSLDYTFFFFAW